MIYNCWNYVLCLWVHDGGQTVLVGVCFLCVLEGLFNVPSCYILYLILFLKMSVATVCYYSMCISRLWVHGGVDSLVRRLCPG